MSTLEEKKKALEWLDGAATCRQRDIAREALRREVAAEELATRAVRKPTLGLLARSAGDCRDGHSARALSPGGRSDHDRIAAILLALEKAAPLIKRWHVEARHYVNECSELAHAIAAEVDL